MNGELFKIIDGGYIILRRNGVYRQAKLYELYRSIFAQYGGGFVRLSARGGTTEPNISWEGMSVPDDVVLTTNDFGAPVIDHEAMQKLSKGIVIEQASVNSTADNGMTNAAWKPPAMTEDEKFRETVVKDAINSDVPVVSDTAFAAGIAAAERAQGLISSFPLTKLKLKPKKVVKAIKHTAGVSKRKRANGRVSA